MKRTRKAAEDLLKFLKGSKTFEGVTFQGLYGMCTPNFIALFDYYLKSGVNLLDDYSKLIHLSWEDAEDIERSFGKHIDVARKRIVEIRKLLSSEGRINPKFVLTDSDIKRINNYADRLESYCIQYEQNLIGKKTRNYPEYDEWRKAVFERDSYTCQTCGKVGGNLNAHHIKSFKNHPTKRHDIGNGLTLCESPCHKEKHKRLARRKG